MPPPLFQKGARIGEGFDGERWQVIRKLGEGQFAEVYEVRDMDVKDRDVRVSGREARPRHGAWAGWGHDQQRHGTVAQRAHVLAAGPVQLGVARQDPSLVPPACRAGTWLRCVCLPRSMPLRSRSGGT